jgi:hypothetical protein
MINLAELLAMRHALVWAKVSGARRVQGPNGAVEYGSDDGFRQKLADLDAAIALASSTTPSSFTLATHSRE